MVLENWTIQEHTGYKPISTFYTDFSIADKFGLEAIQDTYNRVFEGWKSQYKYITELSLVLNWKCFRWYNVNNDYSRLYESLWKIVDNWCFENLKDEELEYYMEITD